MRLENLKDILQAIITTFHAQQMICAKNGYEYNTAALYYVVAFHPFLDSHIFKNN